MTTRTSDNTDTLVVGGGQAGIAMSEHLSQLGVPHLVLERSRIAEAWRTRRWDSLVANGPAWHDRFPGKAFDGIEPDDFASKDDVAAYFEAYARMINAPLRTGVEVQRVTRHQGRPGFSVETSQGTIDAKRVVAATAPSSARSFRPLRRMTRTFIRFTLPTIDVQSSCLPALCWSWAPDPPASRSQKSFTSKEGGCISRWAPMIALLGAIADAISAGGWGYWGSGMPRP